MPSLPPLAHARTPSPSSDMVMLNGPGIGGKGRSPSPALKIPSRLVTRTAPLPSVSHHLDGRDHFGQSVELSLAIARRLKKEGHKFSENEHKLIRELAHIVDPALTASSSTAETAWTPMSVGKEQASTPPPAAEGHQPKKKRSGFSPEAPAFEESVKSATTVGSAAHTPTAARSPRKATLASLSKSKKDLLQVLRRAASTEGLYTQLVTSRGDLHSFVEFSMKCTAADPTEVPNLLAKELANLDKTSNFAVYVLDPVTDMFFMNPISMRVFKEVTVDEVVAAKGMTLKRAGDAMGNDDFYYIPIKLDDEGSCFGVVIMEETEVVDINVSQRTEAKLTQLSAMIRIAALSLKNYRLYELLEWQREKAEAMLLMANQLSRDNLDEAVLVRSIIETARNLTESDRCSVFLVKGQDLLAYFDDGNSVRMPLNSGIAGHVASTGETVNILDAYEDPRFNASVDKATGYKTKTILSMPVYYEDSVVAVAQLINKLPSDVAEIDRPFSKLDEELFETFSSMIGVCLRNCRINAGLAQEQEKTELLLSASAKITESDIRDVNEIVGTIIHGAKHLLRADRASVFLLDKEHDELYSTLADEVSGREIRFPSGKGIAGTVAFSGSAENIQDAYKDTRFNQEIDKQLGYRTRSILCQPISSKGEVLAVAQLVNKVNPHDGSYDPFSEHDEKAFSDFATFAGIALKNAQLLQFAIQAGEEAMMLNSPRSLGGRRSSTFKTQISQAVLDRVNAIELSPETLDTGKTTDFSLFQFREEWKEQEADAAVQFLVQLILSTGLPEKCGCEQETLMRFICECRHRYRRVPYHNFYHVVDACQTIYTFLYVAHAADMMDDVEAFALIIASIAHDLDHMGLNNSFHLKTDSPLGILSSASGNRSVLEVHHCNIAIEILEDATANVFSGLSTEDKATAFKVMIDTILATDMARHGETLAAIAAVAKGGFDKEDREHRKLIIEGLMKAADISNVTKPFPISRQWAVCVTEEFYKQGDKEKERGVDVLPMFDREKAGELASGQIGFINFVARQFFETVASLIPDMKWTVDQIERNTLSWKRVLEGGSAGPSGDASVTTRPQSRSSVSS